jgi:TetR/AcrR family transcriptional repressor of mexJK operon
MDYTVQFMIDEIAMARPGRPKDSVKREEIVAAATALFMENGFELTSMEAVARQANVSKLTIYSHYADKNELFRAIIQNRCDKVGMPKSFDAEAKLPVVQALTQIATSAATIIFREDSIRLMRVVQAEALRHPEIVQAYYDVGPRRVKTAFADLLREFTRQGKINISDPVIATDQFFSLLKGERLVRTLVFLSPSPDAQEVATHVANTVAFFLAAYRAPTTPSKELS